MYSPVVGFEESAARYKSCCCHSRICLLVLAVIEILVCACSIYDGVRRLTATGEESSSPVHQVVLELAITTLCILVAILLIIGILKEKKALLIPHMVVTVLVMLVILTVIGLTVATVVTGENYLDEAWRLQDEMKRQDAGNIDPSTLKWLITAAVILLLLIVLGLTIWFFVGLVRCYRYLKEKHYYQKGGPEGVPLSVYS